MYSIIPSQTAQGQYRAAVLQATPHLYQVSASKELGHLTRHLKPSRSSVHTHTHTGAEENWMGSKAFVDTQLASDMYMPLVY